MTFPQLQRLPVTYDQDLRTIIDYSVPTTGDLLPVLKKLANNRKMLVASRKQQAKVLTSTLINKALIEKEERQATRERKERK